jgi:uncharacterized protein
MNLARLLFSIAMLALPALAQRQGFQIGNAVVPPGTVAHIDLPVPQGVDAGTYIPVSVFHGAQAGPVIAFTAGIHGYEYPPILAAQRLLTRIDAKSLSGTVILVRISHVPAFERRTIFYNPVDGKNLNRVFPGRAQGTQSERIAEVISREVIGRADFHVDLHAGDGAEQLEPWVGIYGGKLAAKQYDKSREIGLAFQFRNVITYRMETQQQVDSGRSCNRQAVAEGKPTVLVEMGELGKRDDAYVSPTVEGVLNVLRQLKMLPGTAAPPRQDTHWLESVDGVSATHTGIWEATVGAGQRVTKGQRLGTIRDYTGKILAEPAASEDAIVMGIVVTPPVVIGETLMSLAKPGSD